MLTSNRIGLHARIHINPTKINLCHGINSGYRRLIFTKGKSDSKIQQEKEMAALAASHPILKRIPKFFRPYTYRFISTPFSHVTSFLILHELSALVPLIGIWYVFHQYPGLIPMDLPSWAVEKGIRVIDKSLESFDVNTANFGDKAKLIMEGAYAYAIVKALFPIRIFFSLALMPVFAKWVVVPMTRLFSFWKKPRKVTPQIADKPDLSATKKEVKKPRL